jgi:CheY-like chemotaxis protein
MTADSHGGNRVLRVAGDGPLLRSPDRLSRAAGHLTAAPFLSADAEPPSRQELAEGEVLPAAAGLLVPAEPEVLVADDDGLVLAMLGLVLRRRGFAVRLASCGHEAVRLYRLHRDTIRVLLLDVQMPGLDGPGTLLAIRALDPAVRCCFMSGDTGSYSAEELLALGAAHILEKPFLNLDTVVETLRRLACTR